MSACQTVLVQELYAKLDSAHTSHEVQMSEVTKEKNSLVDRISDLNFELETMSDRYRYYQTSYESLR